MRMPSRKVVIGSAGAMAAVIALSTPIITRWEGIYTRSYLDIVKVGTVCIGETEKAAVAEGWKRAYTKAECIAMLDKSLEKYYAGMAACIPADTPFKVQAVFLSTTYNIGIKAFCGSSMARRANANDLSGACDALLMWNKAGGRVVKGLDNRRRDEWRDCHAAVREAGR